MNLKILIIGAICLVVFLLGCLQQPGEDKTTSYTATGFLKIKPTSFEATGEGMIYISFLNAAGASVRIRNDSYINVLGSSNGKCALDDAALNNDKWLSVQAEDDARLWFVDCSLPEGIKVGDKIRVNVTVCYQPPISGFAITRNETGTIYGYVRKELSNDAMKYYKVARTAKEQSIDDALSICERFSHDQDQLKQCYSYATEHYINSHKISDIDMNITMEICDRLKEWGVYCWHCDRYYRDMAEYKKDATLCEKIQSNNSRRYCYADVAVAKKDPAICENIEDQEMKDWCYSQISKLK
ncbi:MAG TPA: hypothetical protein ENF58_00175 [Candidatus Altiarchaeales archaeon]|nr:hypothetical protein [Candidatus Altiarchaeales archaeon]